MLDKKFMGSRQVRAMAISGELLMRLGTELPRDAEFVGLSLSVEGDEVRVFVYSKEFKEQDYNVPLKAPVIKPLENSYAKPPRGELFVEYEPAEPEVE